MQEVATFQPPQRKFANLGGPLSTSLLEKAAVPFPTEIKRDFNLKWKTAQVFPICCYSLAVTAGKRAFQRRALRRPHPAWREVTWRHWYGLTQAWGSTTYDWTLGQILPRCREEGCQQNLTESSVKEKTRVYLEGNLTVEEYTYGITQMGIRPYGPLAQYRGWPETRAS